MPSRRHPAVTILAFFHFIVAACCGMCNIGGLILRPKGGDNPFVAGANPQEQRVLNELTRRLEQATKDSFPGYESYQVGRAIALLLLSLLLILSGIGLLLMQRWGQIMSLIYAVLGLLIALSDALISWVLVLPAGHRVLQQPLPGAQPALLEIARLSFDATAILSPLLLFIYPLVVLLVLLWPSVNAAFRAPEQVLPVEEEPYYPGEEGPETR